MNSKAHPGNDFAYKYRKGLKWCTREGLWIKTDGLRCPNCKIILRTMALNHATRKLRVLFDAHGEPI